MSIKRNQNFAFFLAAFSFIIFFSPSYCYSQNKVEFNNLAKEWEKEIVSIEKKVEKNKENDEGYKKWKCDQKAKDGLYYLPEHVIDPSNLDLTPF